MASDKTVVFVTGANTGLGLEIIKSLYKTDQPYDLIIGTRTVGKGEAALESIQKEIPDSPSALTVVQVDLVSDESIEKAVKTIESKFGRLDVLINNGGGNWDVDIYSGAKTMREAWNISWDVNVTGSHILTHHAAPLLLKSSNPRLMFVTSGTATMTETEIPPDHPAAARINIAPAAGWPKPDPPVPIEAYRSSKTGLNMMMRQWHRILLNDGVKVWSISPGLLATGLGGVGPEFMKKMGALDASVGGNFIRDVVQGKRDQDVGKAIRAEMVQPW